MVLAAKLLALVALLFALVWLVYAPGFDSAAAAAAALAASAASLFLKKAETPRPGHVQHVSSQSLGIQAGRDVHVGTANSQSKDE